MVAMGCQLFVSCGMKKIRLPKNQKMKGPHYIHTANCILLMQAVLKQASQILKGLACLSTRSGEFSCILLMQCGTQAGKQILKGLACLSTRSGEFR